MYRRIIMAALVLAALSPSAEGWTANELLQRCKVVECTLRSAPNGQVAHANESGANECWGYFQAVRAGAVPNAQRKVGFCASFRPSEAPVLRTHRRSELDLDGLHASRAAGRIAPGDCAPRDVGL
jgi:hypothetical protein